jgi:hypothetical protein
MTDFEAFLSRIPFQEHKAWTQRIASMVVDGSPVWQVGPGVSPVRPPPHIEFFWHCYLLCFDQL